jgi:protein-S-isoprenylcysteine O-methyltransferase Ste14
MGRIYRRGESFLLVRHGRPSAVRPQVRSGCAVFSVGFVLAIWAITTIRRAGTRVETNKSTTAIVENGPYRFTRNPIYICMFLGQAGLEMGFNSAWIFATLAPFSLQNLFGCNLWDTDTHAEQRGRPAQDLSRSSRAR